MLDASRPEPVAHPNPLALCSLALAIVLVLAQGLTRDLVENADKARLVLNLLGTITCLLGIWSVWRAKTLLRGRKPGIAAIIIGSLFVLQFVVQISVGGGTESDTSGFYSENPVAKISLAIAVLALGFLYISSLRRALLACPAGSRTMSPNKVWLLLIPFFNLVWHIIVVTCLAASYRNAVSSHELPAGAANPGSGWGITATAFSALETFIVTVGARMLVNPNSLLSEDSANVIFFVGGAAAWAASFCWIIYWIDVAWCSKTLTAAGAGPGSLDLQ
jgi:hypothetical protein